MYNVSSDYHLPATAYTEPPATAHTIHHSHGTDLINQPITYATGQFAGQTIRAELHEVQQACLGRKYARVDRRPLDPPPVVKLRLFRVHNAGTSDETQKEIADYDEVEVLGLLCTVDLFPVYQPGDSLTNSPRSQANEYVHDQTVIPSSPNRSPGESSSRGYTFTDSFNRGARTVDSPVLHSSPPAIPGCNVVQMTLPTDDVVYHAGGYPVRESTKMTHNLVGATFVQPVTVEFQGQKSVMFVFADLAVKIEGSFILRYRVFDIFSKPRNHTDLAIQAQCYGGIFRVYSTKEFPGLQASTELTKQLGRWGVRLNIRETERKRRKKGEARSISPLYTETGKRKHSSADNADGDSDDR